MAPAAQNADLYQLGRRYAGEAVRTPGKKNATWKAVAAECGVSREAVRRAANFAAAVDRIAASCGADDRQLVLSAHPRLPVEVVMRIDRTHADRQRYALAQVRADRDPFGKPSAGVYPPFDTHGCAEVLSRKPRNAGLLDAVADRLFFTPRADWPGDGVLARLAADLRRIVAACRSDAAAVRAAGGRASEGTPRVAWKERAAPAPFDAKAAVWQVASVRRVAEKTARELPRVVREAPPRRPRGGRCSTATRCWPSPPGGDGPGPPVRRQRQPAGRRPPGAVRRGAVARHVPTAGGGADAGARRDVRDGSRGLDRCRVARVTLSAGGGRPERR